MLLLIPMVFNVYTDETETNDRSLSVFEYLQKVSVLCTGKNLYVYEKNLICTRKICMYIKNVGTYTVREAHDRLRNSRENEFSFIVKSDRSWKKDVSLMKSFEKDL